MKKVLFIALISLILLSCSQEETRERDNEAEKDIYPDVILSDATYHIGEEGFNPIVMEAGEIIFYSIDGYALVSDMTFKTLDKDKNPIISGSAKNGRIETSGSTMSLDGGVEFKDEERGMKITADSLFYDRDEDTISAEGSVMVESREGSFSGLDFLGDLRSGTYTFSQITEGELNLE